MLIEMFFEKPKVIFKTMHFYYLFIYITLSLFELVYAVTFPIFYGRMRMLKLDKTHFLS